MKEIVTSYAELAPGLHAGSNLIASWDILVKTGQVCVEGSVMKRCYLNDPGTLVIPDNITKIDDNCFRDCMNLYVIVIPDSVTEIGYCVFTGCTDLEKLVVKNISLIESITFK